MRGLITALFGVATIMFVAAYVALMAGKDLPITTVVVGIIAGGIGCLLWGAEIRAKVKR